MPTIKTLTAREFRGIRDATLPFDGRCLVLLGENGAGKSPFVDALEFVFTGRVGYLERAQGVSTSRHAPHIRATPEDTLVEVQFGDPEGKVARTFAGLSPAPKVIRDLIALGAKSTFILRRKNLLDFILAQPGPRYEQLAAIIGVSDLDKTERALMQARDDLEARKSSLEHEISDAETKLRELLGDTSVGDDQILAAVNRKLAARGQPALASLSEVEDRKVAAVAHSRSPQSTQWAVIAQDLVTSAAQVRNTGEIAESYRQLSRQVEQLRQNVFERREVLFQDVLRLSRRLIGDFGLDTCPVCQQQIERTELLASLDRRIRNAEEIAQKVADIKRLRTQVIERIKGHATQAEHLIVQASELPVALDHKPLSLYTGRLSAALASLQPDPMDMRLVPPDDIVEALESKALAASLDGMLKALEGEKERSGPTEQDEQTVAVIDLLTRVTDIRKRLLSLRPQRKAVADTCEEMTAIYDCFVGTKRTEIQATYGDLESDIERFFKCLHADEGYGTVRLAVQEDRRASTEIKVDFHDRQQEDPRAFNSEGHLDSLGLCVFLAFVKRFGAGFPIIALDDVVSSIDSGHRRCICDLLFREFPDCQFFITTHDELWFEELCSHQRAYNRTNDYVNIRITDWSLDTGPRLDKYRPRWERATEKMANGDKEGAAADARKALEAFLYDMAVGMQTPIAPKRDRRYVVGDLHDPFVKRIKKVMPDLYEQNPEVFRNLEANGIFGNLLAHNNPMAASASTEEVQSFIDAVQGIESLFTCPQCGRYVAYFRDARVVRCHCGHLLWKTKE